MLRAKKDALGLINWREFRLDYRRPTMNADEFREWYKDQSAVTAVTNNRVKVEALAVGIEEVLRRLDKQEEFIRKLVEAHDEAE